LLTCDERWLLLTARSSDAALLERCLATSSGVVIRNTVARLLPVDAAAFLRAAVDRLVSRPARGAQLTPWLRAVLHAHTGYLMTAPAAQAPLAALYQAIDARVATYHQLLRLQGRLSLVAAHATAAGRDAGGQQGEGLVMEPEVEFEDDDGEDGVEVEDPFAVGLGGRLGDGGGSDSDDDGEGSDEEGGDGYALGEEGSEEEDEDAGFGSGDMQDD
jgi:U3 small nucleolar RNA-associated protein 5